MHVQQVPHAQSALHLLVQLRAEFSIQRPPTWRARLEHQVQVVRSIGTKFGCGLRSAEQRIPFKGPPTALDVRSHAAKQRRDVRHGESFHFTGGLIGNELVANRPVDSRFDAPCFGQLGIDFAAQSRNERMACIHVGLNPSAVAVDEE